MSKKEMHDQPAPVADLVARLSDLIVAGKAQDADNFLDQLEPQLLTCVLSRLPSELRQQLIGQTDEPHAARYLHELPDVQTVGLVKRLSPEVAANILDELPESEQADIIGDLSNRSQASILAEMPPENAEIVRDLVKYEDDEAGGLMVVRFMSVRQSDTVAEVIHQLQQNAEKYSDLSVQYIYVTQDDGVLNGVLPLRSLILTSADSSVESLMIPNPLTVGVHSQLLELHEFFENYRFVGVPVVNDENQLLGVLRRGDVEEAISARYAKDYLKTQGIVNEELRSMSLIVRSRRRLAWLSINVLLNLCAAGVIAYYQDTLAQVIALAVFLPIISDMSGCSGNQAVAVSMRELSLGLVNAREVLRVWLKEIGVGLINGFCLGLFIAVLAFIWKGNPWLGIVVAVAMMVNTTIAVSIGGTLPLIMKRFGLDPALASGPILTTVTDMCGFFLVLGGASMILDRLI